MVANNEQTNWVPDYVGERRFHNWLGRRPRLGHQPKPLLGYTAAHLALRGVRYHYRGHGEHQRFPEAKCGETVDDLHKHFVDNQPGPVPRCAGP